MDLATVLFEQLVAKITADKLAYALVFAAGLFLGALVF